MVERLLSEVFEHYGLWAVVVLGVCTMTGTMIAQMIAIRQAPKAVAAWNAKTDEIVSQLGRIISDLDRQHRVCERHSDMVAQQMEVARAVVLELRGLNSTIVKSDMERAKELMDVVMKLSEAIERGMAKRG